MISDEGRGLITAFNTSDMMTATTNASDIRSSGSHILRFYSPERIKNVITKFSDDVWSFGVLCYEVCLPEFIR
jgi:serine/threonine protein kinase